MASKMKKCDTCGTDIAISAKACPQCGAKNKKPLTKKWWFWAIVVFFGIGMIGSLSSGNGDDSSPSSNGTTSNTSASSSSSTVENSDTTTEKPEEEPKAEPVVIDVDTLVEALETNALNASNTYKGQYVEVTGKLAAIDSSGEYFSLAPTGSSFTFTNLQCYITKEQQAIVAKLSTDDIVTVVGTITDVGEILGYSMDVESFK